MNWREWTLLCAAVLAVTCLLVVPGMLTAFHIPWYARVHAGRDWLRINEYTGIALVGFIWLCGLPLVKWRQR